MQKKVYEVPVLYGDHHVTEVRSLLLSISGVSDVYASSAFHVVEVTYDETKTTEQEITAKLDKAGYLGDWAVPVEFGVMPSEMASGNGSKKPFFRHTEVFENTRQVVSFSQNVIYSGRPLWPCPGFGRDKEMDE